MGVLREYGEYRHLCTLVLKVQENFMQRSIIEFRIEEKVHTKAAVDMSRGTGGRVFAVFLGETERGLVGTCSL